MILVIGGTGTIGKPLVERLLADGHKVTVATSRVAERDALRAHGYKAALVDLGQPETILAACEGVKGMFLATPASARMPTWKANAIDAAASAGVSHVVMSTGLGASPKSKATFARWHSDSQERLKASGMGWTLLQPTFFMQNLLWQADSIRAGIYRDDFKGPVAWVDARDIADSAATALTQPGHAGKTYMLTGPEALTCEEIATTLSRHLGRSIKCQPATEQETFDAMVTWGMEPEVAEALKGLNALAPLGYLADCFPASEALIGRAPATMDDFVRDHQAELS